MAEPIDSRYNSPMQNTTTRPTVESIKAYFLANCRGYANISTSTVRSFYAEKFGVKPHFNLVNKALLELQSELIVNPLGEDYPNEFEIRSKGEVAKIKRYQSDLLVIQMSVGQEVVDAINAAPTKHMHAIAKALAKGLTAKR